MRPGRPSDRLVARDSCRLKANWTLEDLYEIYLVGISFILWYSFFEGRFGTLCRGSSMSEEHDVLVARLILVRFQGDKATFFRSLRHRTAVVPNAAQAARTSLASQCRRHGASSQSVTVERGQ